MDDLSIAADEIERHIENLLPRVKRVIAQLRDGKTLGEEDVVLVAQRARSLAESLDRGEVATMRLLRERREAAMRRGEQ